MRITFPKPTTMSAILVAGVFFLTFAQSSSFAGSEVASHGTEMKMASSTESSGTMMMPGMSMGRLMMPEMDPVNGAKVFVNKGCISCHAVNGVGGHDAPAMDAHEMDQNMSPFDFAAKMWNHAPGMIAAQEEAFGEMINFTGQEIADIIAFVHNDEIQHGFNENNLTPMALEMMEHGHGEMTAPVSHAEEVGHGHADN